MIKKSHVDDSGGHIFLTSDLPVIEIHVFQHFTNDIRFRYSKYCQQVIHVGPRPILNRVIEFKRHDVIIPHNCNILKFSMLKAKNYFKISYLFSTCVHIGSFVTVGPKKYGYVPVFSINEQISGVLKGSVEFLLSSSLSARVGSSKAKFSP